MKTTKLYSAEEHIKNDFAENAYNEACNTIGEAVWQLVASGGKVSQEAIASMIRSLAGCQLDLDDSVALSVLHQN